MNLSQALKAQADGRTVPLRVPDDDVLAAHTQDRLCLTGEQRAEAEAALRRMRDRSGELSPGPLSHEAARAVAVSFRLHLRAIGAFA